MTLESLIKKYLFQDPEEHMNPDGEAFKKAVKEFEAYVLQERIDEIKRSPIHVYSYGTDSKESYEDVRIKELKALADKEAL